MWALHGQQWSSKNQDKCSYVKNFNRARGYDQRRVFRGSRCGAETNSPHQDAQLERVFDVEQNGRADTLLEDRHPLLLDLSLFVEHVL